jgi:hypothetical protein
MGYAPQQDGGDGLTVAVAALSLPMLCLQIYPSFFQAPCASEALLPDGLVFSSGALPVVTIVFCAPDQAGLRWEPPSMYCVNLCFFISESRIASLLTQHDTIVYWPREKYFALEPVGSYCGRSVFLSHVSK